MYNEKLEKAKVLKEKIELIKDRVFSLATSSSLEGHRQDDSHFEKVTFQNRSDSVELKINSKFANAYYGKISDSGIDQLNVLITTFRNAVASVYKTELHKLEKEYEAL